ncbi:MAG TPA: DUF3303 family protein [Pyrinomonadaceae bacterium]|nr:DUF3303 family protein [Pyrinomonadaceae bacterium]
MLFMVIERYKDDVAEAVYRRFREHGRMMPEGLEYIDSWVEPNYDRCFQLMSADDPSLFQQWISHWDDLVNFEVIPVITSKEAAERFTRPS